MSSTNGFNLHKHLARNQDEELLLNVVAALNNFSYYIDLEGNMVITIRKELFQGFCNCEESLILIFISVDDISSDSQSRVKDRGLANTG